MSANGSFEVNLMPQTDADSPAGRMVIDKNYLGDMNGSGSMVITQGENDHTYELAYEL